ncbi:hypothetical protein NKOR_05835 [Candidatus Nitrosopumilus koreensis AR1]|uniref:Uncharacterized protein n=1 Tax=Candidatus Nitrosopumilus koreensis AR1 TaxID=1229908 RepID=K0B7W9_9ARCH|nr:hypothetical protein [Candidatus Nitrosopumilus koreensis]AFS81050.1 hypothetical protein NKOR_05835 [Candidatus Nitrosopumilus koreensis AR1]
MLEFSNHEYVTTKELIVKKNPELEGIELEESIYKHLKSFEYQDRIYIAFGIAMSLLILTVYLSRKGYTSYTPWLEKLANDKLEFDLKFFQFVDDKNDYSKLKEFYRRTFKKESNDGKALEIKTEDLLDWKPIDENEKWYNVFTEKIDYRFYEIGFEKLWPEWNEINYENKNDGGIVFEKDDEGEFIPKKDRSLELFANPELVPDMSNSEIKKELEMTKTQIQNELSAKEKYLITLQKKLDKIKPKNIKDLDNDIGEKKVELIKKTKELKEINDQIVVLKKKMFILEKLKNEFKKTSTPENYLDAIKTIIDEKIKKITKEREDKSNEYDKNYKIKIKMGEDLDTLKTNSEKLKSSELKDTESKLTNTKLRIRKLSSRNNLLSIKNLENNQTVLDAILNELTIFIEDGKKIQELKKILLRKIQNDVAYYAVMINFRRGLEKATTRWLLADAKLHTTEKIRVKKDSQQKDVGGIDLESTIIGVIETIENKLSVPYAGGTNELQEKNVDAMKLKSIVTDSIETIGHKLFGTKTSGTNELQEKNVDAMKLKSIVTDSIETIEHKLFGTKTSDENDFDVNLDDIVPECTVDSNEEIREKINNIQCKLIDRNEWDTSDWRAMGSIYYKWKEDGKKDKDRHAGIEVADEPISEKLNKNYNKIFKSWLKKEPQPDPTEVAWNKNRTIRAVHGIVKSFGFPEGVKAGKAIVFFGVVFALIISVALTNSLDIVIDTLQLPANCGEFGADDCYHADYYFLKSNFIDYQYMIILLLCFFPLGILFYHQGVIFLSANASEELTLGNKPLIFVNFLVILLQAIVVYFLAASIGDVNAFLSFLMVLVFIDAAWVTIFTWNDMRDEVRDAPVYLEWIVFDIIIGMFAWIFSIHYAYVSPAYVDDGWTQNLSIFLMLLIALATRAAVDYSYGWKNFWSKFADVE